MPINDEVSTANDEQLISATGIAEMTGLKLPTISNWRKRDPNFPKPVPGTEARPLYPLKAVIEWIKDTGKKVEFAKRNRAWEMADVLRGRYQAHEYHDVLLPLFVVTKWARQERPGYLEDLHHETVERLARTCANSLSQHQPFAADAIIEWTHRYGKSDDDRLHINLLQRIADAKDLASLTDELMELIRRESRRIGGEHLSTPEFSRLLISLLPDGGSEYADFGSGYGQNLLHAADTSNGWRLHGLDINEEANRVAGSMLYLHGVTARLETINLLERRGEELFDRITFHAPFGIRFSDFQMDGTIWPFGKPPRSAGDLAWPQLAFQALRDGGNAAVVVAPGVLFRGGANADIIKRMVSQGAIEAVISLPANTQLNTAIPVSILLLQKGAPRGEVLMVDVSTVDRDPQKRSEHESDLDHNFKQAVAAIDAWRSGRRVLGDVSISVPLADLMAPDAVLAPQRWLASLAELSEGDVESLVSDVDKAKAAWTRSLAAQSHPPTPPPVRTSAEAVPLRALPELGLEVTRGDYVRPKSDETYSGQTTWVFTLKSVRTGQPEELPITTERVRKNPLQTLPGDILVTSIGRHIHARVSPAAGLEVDRNVGIVRGLGKNWDPDFVAHQLMSEHNQAMLTGVTVMRVDVKQLLLPQLPIEAQRASGQAFREFSEFADAARHAADRAEAYVTALRNATASGTLTVDAHEQTQPQITPRSKS